MHYNSTESMVDYTRISMQVREVIRIRVHENKSIRYRYRVDTGTGAVRMNSIPVWIWILGEKPIKKISEKNIHTSAGTFYL